MAVGFGVGLGVGFGAGRGVATALGKLALAGFRVPGSRAATSFRICVIQAAVMNDG